ncbi:glutamine--fructose-6-phosphate transaminase (isomerizing) [Halobacteriovorax sp. GB3]|uniref:glutamine--fructose-6-phosphate transaminase (isomerizing) n=1 Tax=Halobacteriovorax sp. GB3 TaxID=2719615 RepID=UPI0023605278|nr:glutamine--fructose-6-phosphate transaminase (isomerizing) [Halobacteriovorax sp. GB3]MDD0854542.1 glutamine--fructose-6-phosphate transaminase (isomerizing) [Halobacteriovorax sp. GB3]
MCGIVGHLGPKNSVEVVLEGLRRLEYRGYDSAGVSFVDEHNDLQVHKKTGKIANLQSVLEGINLTARSCIGHTRWATHGEVNDQNSHPHSNDKISLVHNGIIENASELRDELRAKGYEFKSETDSEVFLALVVDGVNDGLEIIDSIIRAYSRVQGHSAFVVLNSETAEIFAIKSGAPLVCGINPISSEVLVSSDPYALAGMVEKLYFPEDKVLCHLSASNKNLLNFYELDKEKSKRYMSKKQDMTHDASDKGEFEHFMLKEIHEQPELVRSLAQYYFQGEGKESLDKAKELKANRFHICACGTAYYAGLVIKNYIEKYNRIPCDADLASEFRYRNPLINTSDLGLFISQSGETADTLAAQALCKESGLNTLSIVNTEGSTLFRDCSENLLIRAGIEIGVASTKAFTQQALTGRLFAAAMSEEYGSEEFKVKLASKFSLLAERIDQLLLRSEEIKKVAEEIYNFEGFFFTGRGVYFPIALEGALKLKEIAYVHAEGYASGELKHGPIALIDEKKVNIAIVGPELLDKAISNVQEIKARKGLIVTIGPRDHKGAMEVSDYYIPLDFEGLEELAPLYVNVVNQLLSYYMAKFKGTDIDKPRNLAKSVTVE